MSAAGAVGPPQVELRRIALEPTSPDQSVVRVRAYGPAWVHPGEEFEVRLLLDGISASPVGLHARAVASWRVVGSDGLARNAAIPVPTDPEDGELSAHEVAGTAATGFRLRVPRAVWPTHACELSAATLHLSIAPGAGEPRRRFDVVVAEPWGGHKPGGPSAARSGATGLQLATSSTVLEPGATVALTVTRSDATVAPARGELRLVPMLTIGAESVPLAPVVAVPLTWDPGVNSTRCTLEVPTDAPPSFAREGAAMRWRLEANLETEGGPVTLPVELRQPRADPPGPRATKVIRRRVATTPPPLPPLRGGTTNIGWVGAEYDWSRRPSADEGPLPPLLHLRLATPPLALGLQVTPAGYWRHLLLRDIEIGDLHFDRYHRIHARDIERATPVVRVVVEAMRTHPAIGILERWDDRGVAFRTYHALDAALAALGAVQAVLAREIDRLPSPRDIAIDPPAWHALAATLAGTYTPGLTHLEGVANGEPVQLSAVRVDSGRVTAIEISVGDSDRASALARLHRWSVRAGDTAASLPRAVTDALARAPFPVSLRAIAAGEVCARMPVTARDDEGRPVLDAAQARAAIETTVAVRLALDAAGPYR